MTGQQAATPDGQQVIVFLLDVDNTLLNNDQLKADLAQRILHLLGPERAERFWQIYEQVRAQNHFVDYPATVERVAQEYGDSRLGQRLNELLSTIPFRSYVYPEVMATIDYLKVLGTPVILSDGDPVFQPRKIRESGLYAAVDGNVIISVHKEQELDEVFAHYPADRYVIVDDKPRILSVLERDCPSEFTTVLVLQGHYAQIGAYTPRPDFVIAHIGDLRQLTRAQFLHPHAVSAPESAVS